MSEYRPRPNDRLVEPLFDGLEADVDVDADADARPEGASVKTPWILILVVLPAAIATASGTDSIVWWFCTAFLALALGTWLWIEWA
ncbi:MAG: hypothetical protein ABGY29_14105 [bacterium]